MSAIDRSRGCDCCLMAQENWTICPTMISTQHLHLMARISLVSINIVATGGPGAPARYWAHYIWIIELGLVTAQPWPPASLLPPSWTLVQVLTARGAASAPCVSSSRLKTVQVARFAQNLQSTFDFHNILAPSTAERKAALLRSSQLTSPKHKYSRIENRSVLKLFERCVMLCLAGMVMGCSSPVAAVAPGCPNLCVIAGGHNGPGPQTGHQGQQTTRGPGLGTNWRRHGQHWPVSWPDVCLCVFYLEMVGQIICH